MPGREKEKYDKSKVEGKQVIWIMGAPGSGRGTLCERLKQQFKFTHLSSGEIMKQEILSGSYRGDTLYEMISNGEAVPDEIVNDLIGETMMWTAAGSDGFLIDGYPLDKDQAGTFFNDIGNPTKVICLEISDETAKTRLRSRRDFDDKIGAINKRLKTWHEETQPLAKSFNAVIIDGNLPANEVLDIAVKALE